MVTIKEVILMQLQADGDQTYKQLIKAVKTQQTEVSEASSLYEKRLLSGIGSALYSLCNDHGYVFFDHYEQAYALTDIGALAQPELLEIN